MAKTRVRRIGSAEERNSGRSSYVNLKKKGDSFDGYALFTPDPSVEDNPGYLEFFNHYTPATGYFPCIADENGEGCPCCDAGDNPSTRAKVAFLVVDKDDPDPANGEVKLWELNWFVIQDFAQILEEGENVLGQLFRVVRQEGNGRFLVRPKAKKLKVNEMKAAMKEVPDIEESVSKQAARKMEDLDLEDAMTRDDDDDEPTETTTRKSAAKPAASKAPAKGTKAPAKSSPAKGKAKPEPEPEDDEPEDDFDPDEADEFSGEVVVVTVDKKLNKLKVKAGSATFELFGTEDTDLTEFAKGEVLTVEAVKDEDGDFVVTEAANSAAADDPDDDDDDEPETGGGDFDGDSYEGGVTVISMNGEEETLTVETDEGETFELFFPGEGTDEGDNDWSEFDVTDFSDGDKLTVIATKDDDGDMVADAFPVKAKRRVTKK